MFSLVRANIVRLKALIFLNMGLSDTGAGQTSKGAEFIKKAEEMFSNLASEHRDRCIHYHFELSRLAISVFTGDLNDEFVKKLENLWRKAVTTTCFGQMAVILSALVIAKTALGNSIGEDLTNAGRTLRSWQPVEWMLAELVMGALGVGERPDFIEMVFIMKYHMRPNMVPLLLLERGLRLKNYDLIRSALIDYHEILSKYIDANIFNRLGKSKARRILKELLTN